MRVLVTGHAGYLGSVMVPILQAAGHEVVGLDTFLYENCSLWTGREEIRSERKDIRDVGPADLEGFEALIHLAGLYEDPAGELHAEWTDKINHRASVQLGRMAREAGIKRFLYASACNMYEAAGADALLNEAAPLHPLTVYATAKARAEDGLSHLADHSFSPVFMRCATAYGVSPRLRADLLLNELVGWGHTTGRLRIMNDGTPWRSIVHVQDVARAFAAVLAAPSPMIHNQAFNVGANGESYQIRELVEIVRDTVPGCTVEYIKQGGRDPASYRVDFSKLSRSFPDFKPQWNASFGAKDLYEALQEARVTLADMQGRRFVRRSQITHLLSSGLLSDTLRWRAPRSRASEAMEPGAEPSRTPERA